jgi:hypothetical protein
MMKITGLFLVCTLIIAGSLAIADTTPNLTGPWKGVSYAQYSPSGGYEDIEALQQGLTITGQEGRVFSGYERYKESLDGPIVNETLAGVISADGTQFWRDHSGSGISFGEILSDHEMMDYMLFPEGPFVISSHMVKEGTTELTNISDPVNLTGTWNFSQIRKDDSSPSSGIFEITRQQGRIFTGTIEFPEENQTFMKLEIIGIIGTTGKIYAVANNQALYIGEITGENSIHSVVVHPQDDDNTFVINRNMVRNGQTEEESAPIYPDISGSWNISARTSVLNGTISQKGSIDSEWTEYTKNTGPFFTATRHSDDPVTPPVMQIEGVFNSENEAFLASKAPTYVIYHISDENTIEAIVMRKEGDPVLYLDTLVKNSS